jgi:hypothetical protein
MNCLFCGKGPREGVTIFRVNATGQDGVWACETHIKNTDATIHPSVKAIADAINPPGRNT